MTKVQALTIRAAVALAIEGLPGSPRYNVTANRRTVRAHVVKWVHDYARRRGVILDDSDIISELESIVRELRNRR